MTTGKRYKGFFAKAILGALSFKEWIFEALREHIEDVMGKSIGEAVIDATGTGLGITTTEGADPINERRMTIVGDLPCLTDSGRLMRCGDGISLLQDIEGSRTITLQDPEWFEDLPYENADGTTYYVYVGRTHYPIDVGIARDGSRGYSDIVDVPGFTVNPDSVVDGGSALKLHLSTVLTALDMQLWLTSNTDDPDWSYDVVVWLDTDQTGVEVAVDDPDVAIAFFAKLVKDGVTGDWSIDLSGIGDGYLGQSSPSLTAAHYKVAILGPLITDTATLQSDDDWVFVGTVTSAVASETESTAGQNITGPYATYAAGFGVDHNNIVGDPDLGRHTQISVYDNTQDFYINWDRSSTCYLFLENLQGTGSDRPAIYTSGVWAGFFGYVYIPLEMADRCHHADWNAIDIIGVADETITAGSTDTPQWTDGGGLIEPHVRLPGNIAGVAEFYIPIHHTQFEIQRVTIRHAIALGGALQLELIARYDGVGAETVLQTFNATPTGGGFADEDFDIGGGQDLSYVSLGTHYMWRLTMTNDGSSVNSCNLARFKAQGKPSEVRPFFGG